MFRGVACTPHTPTNAHSHIHRVIPKNTHMHDQQFGKRSPILGHLLVIYFNVLWCNLYTQLPIHLTLSDGGMVKWWLRWSLAYGLPCLICGWQVTTLSTYLHSSRRLRISSCWTTVVEQPSVNLRQSDVTLQQFRRALKIGWLRLVHLVTFLFVVQMFFLTYLHTKLSDMGQPTSQTSLPSLCVSKRPVIYVFELWGWWSLNGRPGLCVAVGQSPWVRDGGWGVGCMPAMPVTHSTADPCRTVYMQSGNLSTIDLWRYKSVIPLPETTTCN